jgi:hypothetical protein
MALSRGIEVRMDISKKVIAPAARLSGNHVFIADEDRITLYPVAFRSYSQFIDCNSSTIPKIQSNIFKT